MKQSVFTIKHNDALTPDVHRMVLAGDTSAITRPGQFVNLKLEGFFLRRPISVYDWNEDELIIVYKTVGRGSRAMAQMQTGTELDILTGLGNGYDLSKAGERPLLLGGGVGVPPLYGLARRLLAIEGCQPMAVLGFNTASEVFGEAEFRALEVETVVCTADGSYGVKGFVTDGMPENYTYFYTCGPEPMLRAIDRKAITSGQLSFEERMGCGFGACMGCTCETKYGNKRICRDGPVLEREEIIW